MDDDLVCPECHHSLGVHSYFYGTCEQPIGGIFTYGKCQCPVTLYDLIKKLQEQDLSEEVEKLQARNISLEGRNGKLLDGVVEGRKIMITAQARIEFLVSKLSKIAELLHQAKMLEPTSFLTLVKGEYKDQIHELLDQAILELEKPNE
jgi:hypothetical protein